MSATLVIMAGLPGTGKSAIAARLGGIVLNKDTVRAALFPPELVEYSLAQDDFVVQRLLETAAYLFAKGHTLIVLDGRTHSRKYQVEMARDFAAKHKARSLVIECVCPDEIAIARIEADTTHPAKNRTAELYRAQRDAWEQIEPPKVIIDTSQDLSLCVTQARAAIAL